MAEKLSREDEALLARTSKNPAEWVREGKRQADEPTWEKDRIDALKSVITGNFVIVYGLIALLFGAAMLSTTKDGQALAPLAYAFGLMLAAFGCVMRSRWMNRETPFWAKLRAREASKDTNAVSPVIAVILMVAITVVLAATVFIMVSDIGNKTDQTAPNVGFNVDDVTDHVAVSSASSKADWSRLEINADTTTVHFALNKNARLSDPSADQWSKIATVATPLKAGDYLGICGPTTGAGITIRDSIANAVIFTGRFTNLVPCA